MFIFAASTTKVKFGVDESIYSLSTHTNGCQYEMFISVRGNNNNKLAIEQ